MTHALVLVVGDDVEKAMAPFDENAYLDEKDEEGYPYNPQAKWDYWQEVAALLTTEGEEVSACPRSFIDLERLTYRQATAPPSPWTPEKQNDSLPWAPFALLIDGEWIGWHQENYYNYETSDFDGDRYQADLEAWRCSWLQHLHGVDRNALITAVDFHR
jgi:hypothetical protein